MQMNHKLESDYGKLDQKFIERSQDKIDKVYFHNIFAAIYHQPGNV